LEWPVNFTLIWRFVLVACELTHAAKTKAECRNGIKNIEF